MEKLQLAVESEYFHLLPTQKFLKELIDASKETCSQIGLKIPYKTTSGESIDDFYVINGKRTEKLADMTRVLINVQKGETIELVFDDTVSVDYINNFKGKIEQLFK